MVLSIGCALSLCSPAVGQPSAPKQPETISKTQIPPADKPLHVGFTYAMFVDVNMADARNSIKALTASIAREVDIAAETDPYIFQNTEEAAHALNEHQLGAVSMTISEFWLLRHKVKFDRFLVNTRKGNPTNAYVVLAGDGGLIKKLADLRGKRVLIYDNPAMCLASVFVDVELAKQSLPPLTKIVGNIAESSKPTKVVLPVFFGQADACIITRHAFETMVELNPQVGRRLKIVASSPDYVTGLFGFQSDLPDHLKDKSIKAFVGMRSSTFGKQTLAIFQSEEISELYTSTIEPSLTLLDEHARLCPQENAALVAALMGLTASQRAKP